MTYWKSAYLSWSYSPICTCNGHIIIALTNRPSSVPNKYTNNPRATAQSRQIIRIRNQVARLLIINGIVFFACQGPYRMISVHTFWKSITDGERILTESQYGMLAVVSRSLILCNSCCNPFIYYASSSYYRSGFRKAFCGLKKQDDIIMNTISSSFQDL